ncbi:MAG: acyl--CoA ligase, partial [Lautropia sp.]|nr:acyl--CoA ligase [Lautropia sp.]
MNLPTATWGGRALPVMRSEAHFGDRIVRCFVRRPPSLDRMFRASTARHPARDAVIHEGARWSYAQLSDAVDRTAAGLQASDIERGDRVAMLIGNRPAFIVALLAIQRLRAIAVPISIREQAPGIAYMLGQCGARMLIHDKELAERLPKQSDLPAGLQRVSLGVGSIWHQWQQAKHASGLRGAADEGSEGGPEEGSEEDTAVILYTSGTTGRPKGAMLSHLNIVHSALHYEFCMALTGEDRSAMAVPASHVTGLVGMIMAMLQVGGAIVIVSSFKARSFLELAAAHRITHTILVPAMYQLCLLDPDFASFDLGAWRIGAYGGAPMPRSTIEALAGKLPRMTLMNAYGATETSSPATIMPAGQQADHLASVGKPVPAADIRVMDEAGREVPAGTSGELWIGGPMVVAGYWDDPQASAAAFTGGCWRSGDIGSIDTDGYVQVLDRKKDMLNRGGYKIYSVEVENVLLACEGVLEAAVVGRPCPVLGERVHAVVSVTGAMAADVSA